MTTTKQVKELVRPLIDRHRDLVLCGRYLCLTPFDHFARRILIDRCSHPDLFVPSWSLTELFIPEGDLQSYGRCNWSIRPSHRAGRAWCASDPTTAADFVEVVENETLPLLRSLDGFQACVDFALKHPATARWIGYEWSVMLHIAEGDLDTARREWEWIGQKYVRGGKDLFPECQYIYDEYYELGALLIADDRKGLAERLHRFEARAVVGTKMEPHWRRSPFPLEAGPA